jgi:RHS repeat-associated protein
VRWLYAPSNVLGQPAGRWLHVPWGVVTATTEVTITAVDVAITGLVAANNSPTVLGSPTTLMATVSAGTNVAYAWAFGDGVTGSGATVTHTYASSGTYTATVTAANGVSVVTATTTVEVTPAFVQTTRTITYTYDGLHRLTAADYSTGEQYAYQYDAVGNRVALTDTTGTTTYTYDAANRLTQIQLPDSSIQAYTWDARGNLLTTGAFTYTYDAAGRMVRAASQDLTSVYTYTADGLRVQQAVDGVVTAFAWDWATGVPELLTDGAKRYLFGHDTLGWADAAGWTYPVPDALGSVRQAVDASGAVLGAREWSPYGVEIGTAQAGLGYTGEWWDAAVGLQYLRARWYHPGTGRFTQIDPSKFEANLYLYATANPVRFLDPSGLCAEGSRSTDCERFVAEVQLMIDTVKRGWGCNTLKLLSDANVIVDFLAYYYSGIPATGAGLYLSWLRFDSFFRQGTPDRWAVPDWEEAIGFPDFEWNHPINELDSPLGQEMRHGYGFRRPYFDNTHHYFGYLKLAYYYGTSVANVVNLEREKPTLDSVRRLWQSFVGTPDEQAHEQRYAWYYREAIYDLYIVHEATAAAFAAKWLFNDDISFLPQLLYERWCASDDADVWALEGDVDKYYFDLPQRYWPPRKYWPESNR